MPRIRTPPPPIAPIVVVEKAEAAPALLLIAFTVVGLGAIEKLPGMDEGTGVGVFAANDGKYEGIRVGSVEGMNVGKLKGSSD